MSEPVSRRTFVGGALACGAWAAAGPPRAAEPLSTSLPAAGARPTSGAQDALDAALELFARTGAEYQGGLANHGPMAAEALVELGRGDAVLPWAEHYARLLEPPIAPREPIRADQWRAALGDPTRMGDWQRYFVTELAERPWPELLSTWAARLGDGYVSVATHGVIRVSHAVRALSRRDNAPRRAELAAGLAYWAARYTRLPPPTAQPRPLPPAEALRRLPLLPSAQRTRGFITDRLAPLARFAPFGAALDGVALAGPPERVLGELCAAFARGYLAGEGHEWIALLHSVTGPAALRPLLPYLAPDLGATLLRAAWRAGAAMYAAHAPLDRAASAAGGRPWAQVEERAARLAEVPPKALVDAALRTRDEHAFKLAAACLHEHALAPDPVLPAAVRATCERLGAPV